MRDPLDLIIGIGCAALAINLFWGAWKEAKTGKPVPFLLPGMPSVYRHSSPNFFRVRLVGILMAASLALFLAVVTTALWIGIL